MILCCPRCGDPLRYRAMVRGVRSIGPCATCALEVDAMPAWLVPSAAEVSYGLDAWPMPDRVAITAALSGRGVPYRWELNLVLVVPEAAESLVDTILDAVESGLPTEPSSEPVDGGPQAHGAMSDLFVVADRLQHGPYDPVASRQLRRLVDTVTGSAPPFGLDTGTWTRVQDLGVALAGAIAADEEGEVIAGHAAELRKLLRALV